jgi:hypothetical protein
VVSKTETEKNQAHSPAAFTKIYSTFLMVSAVIQIDLSGTFLQLRMRSRGFITLPKVYGDIFK